MFRLNINKHQWGKKIRISSTVVGKGAIEIRQRDESNKQLSVIVSNNSNVTILDNTKYLELNFNSRMQTGVTTWSNIQIEEGSVATSYEPYKSNILTVNEDVTLRSNGSVCDELDLLTGKLTQRIDEDGEVLSQEVVKTVVLNVEDQDGNKLMRIRPIEGTMYISTSSNTLQPTFTGEIPVEAITQNLASFIGE